ncbi:MAG: NAD(+)/NADH kinase [Candidatus Micrarchaeota archaeon]
MPSKPFNKFGIVCKDSSRSRAVAKRLAALLDARVESGELPGYFVESKSAAHIPSTTAPRHFSPQSLCGVECIIVIGGDGAMLAAEGAYPGVPKLEINSGNVGFLSQLDSEFEKGVESLLEGKFKVSERSKLEIRIEGKSHLALNDAYAYGEKPCRPVNFRLACSLFDEVFYANGIVLATPTGSTAHSYSAGGPVVPPELECIVVTPVVPLNPLLHSFVLAPDETISIEAVARKAACSVDGLPGLPFEKLEASLAKEKARFAQIEGIGADLMKKLRRKMLY